jgi:RNA polymerase sigma-70 factor (ECF subfamily)
MDTVMDEPLTDQILAERARAGDRGAFEALVERHRGRLERLVRSRLGPGLRGATEAEDVVQETLAGALESIRSFAWRGEGSFLEWLGGIAEHAIQMAARSLRRRPTVTLGIDPPASGVSPSRAWRRAERLERLERGLAALPPAEREVLRLSRFERLKHAEIAARLGKTPEAVRQIAVRALRRLRTLVGETESLGLPAEGSRDGA